MIRALAIAVVAACGSRDASPPAVGSGSAPAVFDAAVALADAPAPSIDAGVVPGKPVVIEHPGPVYLMARGVFQIDPTAGVRALDRRDALFNDLVVDRRGRAWVNEGTIDDNQTLVVYDGGTRRIVMQNGPEGWLATIAPASDGGVWVTNDTHLVQITSSMRVVRHALPTNDDGEAFESFGVAHIIDAGPTVWLGTNLGVFRYTVATKKWEQLRPGNHADALVRDGNGVVWTIARDPSRLAAYANTTWTELAVASGESIDSIAASVDGTLLALVTPAKREDSRIAVAKVVAGKLQWVQTALGDRRGMDELFAVDEAGRSWLSHRYGLLVLDPQGHTLAELPVATVPELPGNLIYGLAVVRGGPTKLPEPQPRRTGTIRGRLLDESKQPLHASIDICVNECEGKRVEIPAARLVPDAEGRFQVDVTITEYSSARRADSNASTGTEHVLASRGRGFECCLQVPPGKTLDVGTLIVKPPD